MGASYPGIGCRLTLWSGVGTSRKSIGAVWISNIVGIHTLGRQSHHSSGWNQYNRDRRPVLKAAEPALGNFSDDPLLTYPIILEVASSAYAGLIVLTYR